MRHSKIPVEENLQNEFKAHRDLSKLDLSEKRYRRAWTIEGPPKEKGWVLKDSRNRAAISKTICGMLNTGLKSTIYMGVTDSGQVIVCQGPVSSNFMCELRDVFFECILGWSRARLLCILPCLSWTTRGSLGEVLWIARFARNRRGVRGTCSSCEHIPSWARAGCEVNSQ